MTTIFAAIFILVIIAASAFKWGYSDGEEKGYEEGLDDGAQLFRGSNAMALHVDQITTAESAGIQAT